MSTRSFLCEWLWPSDVRSTVEIEAGVREELGSHIERMVDERTAAGIAPEEARREAIEHFGDVERYAAECRRIDLGDRLLVRRALAVACLALLALSGYLGWRVWESEQAAQQWERAAIVSQTRSERAEQLLQERLAQASAGAPAATSAPAAGPPKTVESWVTLIKSFTDHKQAAFAFGPELTLLPPDEGLAIVRQAWPQLTVSEVKTGLLKAFAFSDALAPKKHSRMLQVLDLGMTDRDADVRIYASSYLQQIARQDFSHNPAGYAAWYREYGEKPIDEVLRLTQESVPDSLRTLVAEMETEFRKGDARDAGSVAARIGDTGHPYAIPAMIGIIDADNSYDTVYGVGYFGLGRITGVEYSPFHDGPWWRRWWKKHKSEYPRSIAELPIPEYPKTPHGADYRPFPEDLDTLAGLLRYFASGGAHERTDIWGWATEVAKLNDPAAIPFLIGVIDADNTYDTVYGVGYFGLGKLTGVRYDADHDGAWWRAWWNENKSKYSADVQAIEIPDLRSSNAHNL